MDCLHAVMVAAVLLFLQRLACTALCWPVLLAHPSLLHNVQRLKARRVSAEAKPPTLALTSQGTAASRAELPVSTVSLPIPPFHPWGRLQSQLSTTYVAPCFVVWRSALLHGYGSIQ